MKIFISVIATLGLVTIGCGIHHHTKINNGSDSAPPSSHVNLSTSSAADGDCNASVLRESLIRCESYSGFDPDMSIERVNYGQGCGTRIWLTVGEDRLTLTDFESNSKLFKSDRGKLEISHSHDNLWWTRIDLGKPFDAFGFYHCDARPLSH